ncbi:type II toxin-antitoxin system RelE/ParE family toxin [Candidatus Thiosymbion oneisti]|uniref:type II toxin-antitoxin system RelE/ParE family toxin n=1 Tax=Candidatus Thiosymbion oneisti TaxID=589554 RepID=UPI000B7DCFD9|nr:type II toxin-antitoxin system RelE/ParE family toxin [Candidatus Thiosymbion oneisti]
MRRVFRTRTFTRWMRRVDLSDATLCKAISEMEDGLIDADLGGGVLKKRIALPGQGRRGGARTIVATNLGSRWFFLYGFAKNERVNIDERELRLFREVATDLLGLDDRQIAVALSSGEIEKICHDHNQE